MAPSKTTTLPFPGGCARRPLPRQVYGRPARAGPRVALARDLRAPKHCSPLYKKNWRVYLKRPFGGPQQVLAYLANYSHRVAIANSRIRQIDEATGKVTITYRDYADGAKIKLLKLSGTEFIRRFSLHLLPPRFSKIRHYGILGNNRKSIAIPTVRLLLHSLATVRLLLALARRPTNTTPVTCTRCHIGQMRLFALCTPRGTFRAGPPLFDMCKSRPTFATEFISLLRQ